MCIGSNNCNIVVYVCVDVYAVFQANKVVYIKRYISSPFSLFLLLLRMKVNKFDKNNFNRVRLMLRVYFRSVLNSFISDVSYVYLHRVHLSSNWLVKKAGFVFICWIWMAAYEGIKPMSWGQKPLKQKGKAEHLYSALHGIQTTQAWITQFYLQ